MKKICRNREYPNQAKKATYCTAKLLEDLLLAEFAQARASHALSSSSRAPACHCTRQARHVAMRASKGKRVICEQVKSSGSGASSAAGSCSAAAAAITSARRFSPAKSELAFYRANYNAAKALKKHMLFVRSAGSYCRILIKQLPGQLTSQLNVKVPRLRWHFVLGKQQVQVTQVQAQNRISIEPLRRHPICASLEPVESQQQQILCFARCPLQ